MKQKLPVPTANDINDAHRMARTCAESAVEHAIRCGQMLMQKKASLRHGEFEQWVTQNCEFSDRQARRYMQAAEKTDTRVRFDSLRQLLGIESKPAKKQEASNTSARSVKGEVMNPPESAAQGSEAGNLNTPSGVDAGQVRPPAPAPMEPESDLMPEPEISAEEIAEIDAEVERERAEFADKIMSADDRLAAADAEVQRLARDLANMTRHRDHWMNQAGANARFAKGLQRKIDRLTKELKDAKAEVEGLRERIAIMGESA